MIKIIDITDIEEMMVAKNHIDKLLKDNGEITKKTSVDHFYQLATEYMRTFLHVNDEGNIETISYSINEISDDYYVFVTHENEKITKLFETYLDDIINNDINAINIEDLPNVNTYIMADNKYFTFNA